LNLTGMYYVLCPEGTVTVSNLMIMYSVLWTPYAVYIFMEDRRKSKREESTEQGRALKDRESDAVYSIGSTQ
jgi:hypothetical protein